MHLDPAGTGMCKGLLCKCHQQLQKQQLPDEHPSSTAAPSPLRSVKPARGLTCSALGYWGSS